METFQKRQKEMKRLERQRDKAARRMQRKQDKENGVTEPSDAEPVEMSIDPEEVPPTADANS